MIKKTIAAAFAIGTLVAIASQASAACPPYAPYRCVPTWGGKMQCGCGV